jgi:hypothetical protein
MDIDGKSLVKRHGQMKSARSTLDTHCQEIASLVLPMMATFNQQNTARREGEKRTMRLFESTAPLALTRYASAVEGFLVPRGEKWAEITTDDSRLNQSHRVKLFFDEANKALGSMRFDPEAAFHSQMHSCLTGIGAFGTSALFVNGNFSARRSGKVAIRTSYTAMPLVNIFISQGANGKVDTVHREWRHSARNCIADFKEECPPEIVKAAEKDPDQEFTILHCVQPNPDRIMGAIGPRGMAFASYYVWVDKGIVISRGGYNTLRYAIARGPTGAGEHYGNSAAMAVLAEIKTINEMRRKLLRQQDMSLNPPTLIHSELGAQFNMVPGHVNPGMVSPEGRPLAIPFNSGANFVYAEREMERIREVINDAFLITLFQILIQRPQQTATETLQRAKEQAILLAPLIGRLQDEFLGSIITSEVDILAENGLLPEMPPELVEAEGEYKITYKSDITRALASGDLEAYQHWFADVAPMANVNPDLLEIVDHEGVLREAAEKRGIPTRFIRTDEQLEELRARKQGERQAMQTIPAAEALTSIENKRAQTDKLRRAG